MQGTALVKSTSYAPACGGAGTPLCVRRCTSAPQYMQPHTYAYMCKACLIQTCELGKFIPPATCASMVLCTMALALRLVHDGFVVFASHTATCSRAILLQLRTQHTHTQRTPCPTNPSGRHLPPAHPAPLTQPHALLPGPAGGRSPAVARRQHCTCSRSFWSCCSSRSRSAVT